jgi:hypothetical protein
MKTYSEHISNSVLTLNFFGLYRPHWGRCCWKPGLAAARGSERDLNERQHAPLFHNATVKKLK